MKVRSAVDIIGLALVVVLIPASGRGFGRAVETVVVPDGIKAVLQAKCAVCHKGVFAPKQLKLGADAIPASVLNVSSKEKPAFKLIDPETPDASYLLHKIKGADDISGKPMPPPGKPALTAEEIALIEGWITSLKPKTE
ncbi:MAG: hypothetical protein ACYDH0_08710 [Candidatus Aminicenantales bacterium]